MEDGNQECFECDEQLCFANATEAEKANLLADIFLFKSIRTAGTMEDPLFCAVDVGAHVNDSSSRDKIKEFFSAAGFKQHIQSCQVIEGDKTRWRMFFTENGLYTFLFRIGTENALALQSYIHTFLKHEREWAASRLAMKLDSAECRNRSLKLFYLSAESDARLARKAAKSTAEELERLRKQLGVWPFAFEEPAGARVPMDADQPTANN